MRLTLLIVIVLLTCASCPLAAQEKGGEGIFQSRQEYNEFFGSLKSLGDPEINAMLPIIHDITTGRQIGSTPSWGKAESPMMQVLSDPAVRKEIDMVDDQYKQLEDRSKDLQKEVAGQLRGLDLTDTKNLAREIREIRSHTRKELEAVLLPHQVDRLRQIAAQSQLRRRTLVDLLTSEPLKTKFEISDEQAEKLEEAEDEINEELAAEIARLRAKAREKLLSNLRRSQREAVEDLFGDPFETSSQTTKRQPRKK